MQGKQKNPILVAFGVRIRAARKEAGLSQEALGEACELDRTYVSSVERGERNISLLNIHKISQALNVRIATLLEE
mgnify:CR=1 FL=1